MAAFDFMENYNSLRENYKSYEEKSKKSLLDLDESITKKKDLSLKGYQESYIEPTPGANPVLPNTDINLNYAKSNALLQKPSLEGALKQTTESNKLFEEKDQAFEDQKNSDESNFLGQKGKNQQKSVFDFALNGYNALSNVSSSESESVASAGNLALSGAQAGMSVGGPIGAVVGGVAGLGVGVYDYFSDMNKRKEEKKEKYMDLFEKNKTQREQDQRMKDGQESLSKLTELRKGQLNYINKY